MTREDADALTPDDSDLAQTLDGPPKGADGAPPPGPMKPLAEGLGITNLLNKAGAIFGRKGGAVMVAIDAFFDLLLQRKASDLHLSVGKPPMLRCAASWCRRAPPRRPRTRWRRCCFR